MRLVFISPGGVKWVKPGKRKIGAMTKVHRQRIRGFDVPFKARWDTERVAQDVRVETRDHVKKIGDIWSATLVINEREIVTGYGTSNAEADAHCWELLQSYVGAWITDVQNAAKAVAEELKWTPEEGLAVVLAFCRAELGPLRYAGLSRVEGNRRKGRGRQPTIDQLTTLSARMVEGWQWLTGREIGFSSDGWLPRAIEALGIYGKFQRRDGKPYVELRDALRAEAPKYLDGIADWAPTTLPWPPSGPEDVDIGAAGC